MYDENLFTPIPLNAIKKSVDDTQIPSDPSRIFIEFLNKLEGWKTKCKNLHWAAPKKNIHQYLDEFLSILSDSAAILLIVSSNLLLFFFIVESI